MKCVVAVVSLIFSAASSTRSLGACPQDTYLSIDGQVGVRLSQVARAGDMDGDGVADVIVGTSASGYIQARSGADGSAVHGRIGGGPAAGVDSLDGGWDFDDDGVPDFLWGDLKSGGTFDGEVRVYSGVDNSLIVTLTDGVTDSRLGMQVAFVGDVNLDGYADVAAAGIDHPVHVFLGPDGTLLRTHTRIFTRPDVDAVGDVDGDGHPDYVIGWPQVSTASAVFAGQVTVFSGRDGKPIHTVYGTDHDDHLGRSVAGVGDVDGDGVPDFAGGAPGEVEPQFGHTRGAVRIFSGADASLLLEVIGPGSNNMEWTNFGDVIDGGGDVNGDGAGDVLVGAPWEDLGDGTLTVLSGRTGTLLWKVHSPDPLDGWHGRHMTMMEDLTGDGIAEFAHGWGLADHGGLDAGRVTMYAGSPGDAERICVSSPNSAGPGATLHLKGPISAGNNELTLAATGAIPGQAGLFFYGPDVVNQPFGDGILCVGPGNLGLVRLGDAVVVDGAGTAERPVDFQAPPLKSGPKAWTPGSTWTIQFWYRDPAGPGGSGFNTSDAMRVTFTP